MNLLGQSILFTNQFFATMNLLHQSIVYPNESSAPFNLLRRLIAYTKESSAPMNVLHQSILCDQWFAPINSSQSVLCTNESSAKPIFYTNQFFAISSLHQ
jgi:hypothetical protein